ncbi:hypothetical protein MFIFM68171_10202 [Madurella fahalii]|uniref:Apple domain-containing protein n=1 Tax=Madurella fahalii TaxID=1157608 RepID=A0ABQ0GQI6_9PEZI
MGRPLRRLAILSLASLPSSLAVAVGPEVTCVGKAHDQATYTGPSGAVYQIECGVDYAGGDIGATQSTTFAGCIDAETGSGGDGGDNNEPQLTCVGGASDQSTYTSVSGTVFQILCGIDYAGGDIAGTDKTTFAECIDACATTPGCVDVSYAGTACYMKNKLGEAAERDWVWTAKVVEPGTGGANEDPSLSCEDNKSDGEIFEATVDSFEVTCGKDYAGGDLLGLSTASFEECIEACDARSDCLNVAYVNGGCYLKGEQKAAVDNAAVWGAVRKPKTTPTTTDNKPLDCGEGKPSDGKRYGSPSGGLYQILCGVDFGGGDLTATTTSTFEECIAACDANTECIDVSFAAPACYLKKELSGEPHQAAHVWTAEQLRAPGNVFTFPSATPMDPGSVRLNITYAYPSIALGHSIFIKDIVCEAGTLHGRFNISFPYYFAAENWPTGDDVLLITSADSCGDDPAQNAFFLAHTVSFREDSLSFEALGQLVQLADVFDDLVIDFGNITTPAASEEQDEACGTPSADTLHGLPAVPCGNSFDKALDDKLGYYSAAGGDIEAVLSLAAPAEDADVLEGRFFKSLFKAITKAVITVVKVVATVVVAVAKTVVEVVKKAAQIVVNTAIAVAKVSVALAVNAVKLIAFAVTGKYENSLTLPLALGPPSTVEVESPWGKAIKILVDEFIGSPNPEPGIELYCVNCGVRGSVKATGRINATPLSGVKEAAIGISGNMYVGMYLGVNAFAQWEKGWEKELFSKGLPGWSIPGIVTLGPKIILSAKAMVGVEAEGQILTGASLTWPGFEATLDMVHPERSSKSGWTPEIDRTFQVRGGVTATASVGLPVKLWFGIDILNGVFKKGAALVDTPALTGTAEFEINAGTDENSVGSDGCLGIAWDIALTNEVTLEIDDGPEWTLHEWASPALAEGCIGWDQPEEPELPDLPDLREDNGLLKCPQANGQVYTDDKGNQWQIKCNSDYMYYDTVQTWTNTMEECMSWCAGQGNCAGVSYGVDGPGAQVNCWARSRAGPSRNGIFHSMMLMSPFEILSVVYGTADITGYAIQNWQVGNRIEIDTNAVRQSTTQDRIPGHPKSTFMLYRFGAETRSWVGAQDRGIVTIRPGPISSAPGSSMLVPNYPRPGDVPWIRIVEVAYGLSQVRNQNAFNVLYYNSRNRAVTTLENALFGDTWVGIVKSAVIWYPRHPIKLMRADGSFNKRLIIDDGGGGGGGGYIPPTSTTTATTLATSTTPAAEPTTTSTTEIEATTEAPSTSATGTATNTETTATSTSSPAAEATAEPGYGIVTIRDTTGALQLYPANNGNLFLSAVGTAEELSLLTNGTVLAAMMLADGGETPYVVAGDSLSRLLHYFPGEVSRLGASRLRLAGWDRLPVGSRLISLVPVRADTGGAEMLVAVAGDGDYLWPVMCAIEGQLNKVFLVRDHDEASIRAALEADDAKFVLTGGQASKCGVLALVAEVEPAEVPEDQTEVVVKV